MKKIILITELILTLLLSSCSKIKTEYEDGEDIAYRYDEIILEAIKNDEPEKIKELFCPRLLREHDDIDTEIEELIQFVDGNIISVGKRWGNRGQRSTRYPDGLVFERYKGEVFEIITDTGRRYELRFEGDSANIEAPSHIGLLYLTIVDSDKYEETGDYVGSGYYIRIEE